MFAGLPSNYRLSVLAGVEKDPDRFLGKTVCPSRSLTSVSLYACIGVPAISVCLSCLSPP